MQPRTNYSPQAIHIDREIVYAYHIYINRHIYIHTHMHISNWIVCKKCSSLKTKDNWNTFNVIENLKL